MSSRQSVSDGAWPRCRRNQYSPTKAFYPINLGVVAMDWQERITADPAILVGKPVIRGTRISVEWILDLMAGGWTQEEILEDYPHLCLDDLRAVLAYAADAVRRGFAKPLAV